MAASSSHARSEAEIEAAAEAIYSSPTGYDYTIPKGTSKTLAALALAAADRVVPLPPQGARVAALESALRSARTVITAARMASQSTLPNTATALRDAAHSIDDLLAVSAEAASLDALIADVPLPMEVLSLLQYVADGNLVDTGVMMKAKRLLTRAAAPVSLPAPKLADALRELVDAVGANPAVMLLPYCESARAALREYDAASGEAP